MLNTMTTALQQAVAQIEMLPRDEQDRAAEILVALASDNRSYQLTPQQLAGVELAMQQADRGQFATKEQVRELFGRDL